MPRDSELTYGQSTEWQPERPRLRVSDKVPTDWPIDGIDASTFLLGESATSGRQSYLFFGPLGSLMSVKWHNMNAVLRYSEGIDQPEFEGYERPSSSHARCIGWLTVVNRADASAAQVG